MIGERIGNYVITTKLGEGGMGEVYLAEHPQIGKKVALKVLHAELAANEEITTRFFHEAKAVNDISHPNIVDILDYGSTAGPQGQIVYLVMELLNGSTVTKALEAGPLEPLRAVKIVKQVADALVASHERGIIHRDLKPDNIMLVARGREPEFVKLLDFGIAKVTAGGGGSMQKTRTGMVIGTPIYMSPEQCEGRGDIDHRTDVYALGTVLYELITGAPPFTGSGYAEVLVKQLTEEPEPVTQRRPGISRYLESIIMKSLAKRRENRFQTMRELHEALSNPQEFVDARGGVSGFTAAQRPSSPTGPQLPTPLHGGQPTPYLGQPTPLHGAYGQPTAIGQPTPLRGQPTPYPATGQPTPLHGTHGQPTPYPATGQPTPLHGYATGEQAPSSILGVGPHQTTLSQGVGEVGPRGRGTEPPPIAVARSSNKKVMIGAIAGAVVVGGMVIAVVMGGGKGSKSSAAQTEPMAAATPVEEPTPVAVAPTPTAPVEPTPPTPPTQPPQPPVPTAPSLVKISIATTPVGAGVFVGDEVKQRCATPCAVDVPPGEAKLTLKLSGYADEKRIVTAKANVGLDLELTKKKVATRPGIPGAGAGSAGKPKARPVGDNMLDPFDN